MAELKKETIKEEKLEESTGGRPWGTWVPVDEGCPDYNRNRTCPFYPADRRFDNCSTCKAKDSE